MTLHGNIIIISVAVTFLPLFLAIGPIHLRLSYISLAFLFLTQVLSVHRWKIPEAFIYLIAFYCYMLARVTTISDLPLAAVETIIKTLFFYGLYKAAVDYHVGLGLFKVLALIVFGVVFFHVAWLQQFFYYKEVGEAKYLLGLVPLIIYLLYGRRRPIILSIFLLFLVLSGERKALLALMCCYGALFVGVRNLRWMFLGLCLAILPFYREIIDTLVLAATVTSASELVVVGDNISNQLRLLQLGVGFNALQDNPFFGGGMYYTKEIFETYSSASIYNTDIHSVPVWIAANFGLFGLVLWLFWLFKQFRLVKYSRIGKSLFLYSFLISCLAPYSFMTEILFFIPLMFAAFDRNDMRNKVSYAAGGSKITN